MRLLYTFVFILFTSISNPSYSLDQETCTDLMAEANTDLGGRLIYSACIDEKSLFFRSKHFKCAKKAMKGKTEELVRMIYSTCN